MYLKLHREDVQRLTDLVSSRITELHSEIRRSVNHHFKDKLKLELDALRRLEHQLHEAECDVMA